MATLRRGAPWSSQSRRLGESPSGIRQPDREPAPEDRGKLNHVEHGQCLGLAGNPLAVVTGSLPTSIG